MQQEWPVFRNLKVSLAIILLTVCFWGVLVAVFVVPLPLASTFHFIEEEARRGLEDAPATS